MIAAAHAEELQLGVGAPGVLPIVDAGDEEIALRARQRRVEGAPHPEIAVTDGEDALCRMLARGVEALLLDLPGEDDLTLLAQAGFQLRDAELLEVAHHEIGAAGRERLAVAAAIHADREAEAAVTPGLHARDGILDHEGDSCSIGVMPGRTLCPSSCPTAVRGQVNNSRRGVAGEVHRRWRMWMSSR